MEAIALFGGFAFCVWIGRMAFSQIGRWMETDVMQEVYGKAGVGRYIETRCQSESGPQRAARPESLGRRAAERVLKKVG